MKHLIALTTVVASMAMAEPYTWDIGLGSQVSDNIYSTGESEPGRWVVSDAVIEPAIWLTYHFERGYLGTMGSKVYLTDTSVKPVVVGGFDHLGMGAATDFVGLPATMTTAYYWFDQLVAHKLDLTLASLSLHHDSALNLAQTDAMLMIPAFQNASAQIALVGEATWQSSERLAQVHQDYATLVTAQSGTTYRYGAKGQWFFNDNIGLVSQVLFEHYNDSLVQAVGLAANKSATYTLALNIKF